MLLNSPRFGFSLIPDARISTQAVELSKAIPGNELELHRELTPPHVTILQTRFVPGFNYGLVLEGLSSYLGFAQEPMTRVGEVENGDTHTHAAILWWKLENAAWLRTLNRELINEVAGSILPPEDPSKLKFTSIAARESFEKTGYSRNLDAYEPHITLAVTDEKALVPELTPAWSRVYFKSLVYAEHGPRGEVKRVLGELELPRSWDY